jgi:hypothetical protein
MRRTDTSILVLLALAPSIPAVPQSLALLDDVAQGEYDVSFDLPPPAQWPADAEVRIAFDYRSADSHHLAVLRSDGARFEKTAGAQTGRLGPVGPWPSPGRPLAVTVKRRSWTMEVLADGRVVARACDGEPYGGRVGVSASGVTLGADDLLLQPVEPVRFSDDFMREPGEEGSWHTDLGEWAYVGLAGGKGQLRPDLSANPFSMRCGADGSGLVTAGDWFWDSYRAQVAGKATTEGGAIGLAFYVQDPRDYYLFCVGARQGAEASQQLLKIVDGQATVLDSVKGGYDKDAWSRLEVGVSNGLIECALDGQLLLSAYDSTFGQGKLGLWAEKAGAAWFDDVEVTSWWAFVDPLTAPELGSWLQLGGQWSPQDGALTGTGSFERPAGVLLGAPGWQDYQVAVDVTAPDSQGVGLYACGTGPDDWYLFRWADGTWQLLSMQKGHLTPMAIVPGDLSRDGPQRVWISAVRGRLQCGVNAECLIDAADLTHRGGRVGLRAEGGRGARFSQLVVRGISEPPSYQPPRVTPQFTKEDTMADWARRGSDWPLDPKVGVRWFRLPFFEDLSFRIPATRLLAAGGPFRVVMGTVVPESISRGAPQATPDGLTVEVAASPGGGASVTCREGNQAIAQGQFPGTAAEQALRIDKSGLTTRVWIGEEPVLACTDGGRLWNSAVGIAAPEGSVDLEEVDAFSTHMLEYTFSGAPTDWKPTLGMWQVTDRWSCSPGWAWMGGSKHQSPLLWSKHAVHGDQTFEFWAAMEMDTDVDRGGYLHPSDINCTICGDGRNLCSGYSFVFAGDKNTCTKILKGNTPVAEARGVGFVDPTCHNMSFHRHWFHVKVAKLGADLYMSVDDKWLLQWRDPQPLEGGHIALWTYNGNGLLIARARATGAIVR